MSRVWRSSFEQDDVHWGQVYKPTVLIQEYILAQSFWWLVPKVGAPYPDQTAAGWNSPFPEGSPH